MDFLPSVTSSGIVLRFSRQDSLQLLTTSINLLGERAVATTLSPRASAAKAKRRPKPDDVPV
jgi:hypothetical protein